MGFVPHRLIGPTEFFTRREEALKAKWLKIAGMPIEDLRAIAQEEKRDRREYLLDEQREALKQYNRIRARPSCPPSARRPFVQGTGNPPKPSTVITEGPPPKPIPSPVRIIKE